MAIFTAAGTNQGAALIKAKVEPGFVDGVYRNNQLLGLTVGGRRVFPERDSGGDTAVRWKVAMTANTSTEVFTEGGIQPAAVAQAWTTAAQAFTYFRAMVQITGHAEDAMRSNYVDGLALEFELAEADIRDLMTTSFLGSTYGLELIVAKTGTYAGIARGSAAYWESTVTTLSGALTYAAMLDLHETCRDNDKGGVIGLWLVPHNQLSNYVYLIGAPNAENSSYTVQMGRGAGGVDLGYNVNGVACMGAPMVPLGDMTNETILGLDIGPGNWELVIHRRMGLKNMAPSGDSNLWQVSTASAIIGRHPMLSAKLATVTA